MTPKANATAVSNASTRAKRGCHRENAVAPISVTFDLAHYTEHAHDSANPLTGLGAGDSSLHFDILGEDESAVVFPKLMKEVDWSTMYHKGGAVPRLVAMQGEISRDNSEPIYRHPLDHHLAVLPFTPTVDTLRGIVRARVGLRANHALIQLYRTPEDHISEHADKTLDIKIGTVICNLSFGATRVLTLRTKSKVGRLTQVGGMRGWRETWPD